LLDLGVPSDRISAFYPSYSDRLVAEVNADINSLNADLGLGLPRAGIATLYMWPEFSTADESPGADDFVRLQAIRLTAERIHARQIPGSIAELGVYRGDLAAFLNRLFPTRELHLFDTFEGFAEQDLAREQNASLSKAEIGDFQNTSVDLVLSKMTAPELVKVHQGFFPDTTVGVEGEFALVSLDVDLHDPTLAGLEWFYPRLSRGGAIFVHDYNNRRYLGVRKAVDEFIEKTSASALPLPDFAGSIVIMN
jgi:O-methyltransferase